MVIYVLLIDLFIDFDMWKENNLPSEIEKKKQASTQKSYNIPPNAHSIESVSRRTDRGHSVPLIESTSN